MIFAYVVGLLAMGVIYRASLAAILGLSLGLVDGVLRVVLLRYWWPPSRKFSTQRWILGLMVGAVNAIMVGIDNSAISLMFPDLIAIQFGPVIIISA